MKKTVSLFAVLAMFLVIGLIAYSAEGSASHGKEVYEAQKCRLCHSIAGVGNKNAPLDGVGAKLKAEEIAKWIKTPKEMKADAKMKAYPNLPEQDLNDLVAYLLTLKK
jgi:cytochrome c2